jgi:peptide/nickel transport system substrate-binding protein
MEVKNYWTDSLGRPLSRRGVLRAGGLAGAGLAGAALLGCGSDEDDAPAATPTPQAAAPTPAPTDDDEPDLSKQGGRIGLFYGSTVATFNPIEHIGEGQTLSGPHIYDRLLAPRLDERQYVLEAAESVELPDDVTVVFKLKPGLVFQDRPPTNGRPVLASDIVATQEYAKDPETFANAVFQRGSMESIEAPDDLTVIFHLQRPNAYLFSGQGIGHPDTMAIVPVELIPQLDEHPPVGSGPYQVTEHQLGTRYLYERNPTYREADKGLPYIDERELVVLTDPSAQEAAFRGQQIHVHWTFPVETADRVVRDLGDQLTVVEYTAINGFQWNLNAGRTRSGWADTEIFEDIRIREAWYRATNQQQITELVDNGMAVNCPGTLAVGLERYLLDESVGAPYHRHDPAESRQLLDAAGFDLDHIYRLTTLPAPRNESGLQVLQRQLEEVGIQTRAHVVPFQEFLAPIIEAGNYDFAILAHPAYDTPLQSLRHNHSDPQQRFNSANLGDPEIDAMIERSEEILDFDEQTQLVKDIQVALLENYAHMAHINSALFRNIRWAYVQDWEVSAAGSQHTNYQIQAWLDV